MIKINKFLYIHWLFVVMAVFCYINRQLENFVMSFIIMSVHELSHLLSAKCIGLKCSHITIYPFGLNLKLKNTIIYNLSDEIILYLSGPFSNIIMSLVVLLIGFRNEYYIDFYYKNLALFLINILPIIPLDGGMIIKKVLNYHLGYDGGNKAIKVISIIFLVVLLTLFTVLLYNRKFNPSICIFVVFIIGNIFCSKEKYDTNLLKELLYARDKTKKQKKYSRVIGVDEKTNTMDIAKKFRPNENCFVFLTDENSRIKNILSKDEIIDNLYEKRL